MSVALTFATECRADVVVTWSGQPGRADRLVIALTDVATQQGSSQEFADGRSGSVDWHPSLTTSSVTHRFVASAQHIDARGRTVSQATSEERNVTCEFAL